MRTMRFGRSRWQRRAGAVAFVMAGALVLASCSSGPKGVNVLGPPAKAPTKATAVKTVQFPSGPVAEHIYGPSWARFVAAFPIHYYVASTNKVSTCAVGSLPQYDVTAGTALTGGSPKPPSYDVLIWRCRTAGEAVAFVRGTVAARPFRRVVVDGTVGLMTPPREASYGPSKVPEWAGGYLLRVGPVVYVVEPFAASLASARAFLRSFHLDLAGYTPVPVK